MTGGCTHIRYLFWRFAPLVISEYNPTHAIASDVLRVDLFKSCTMLENEPLSKHTTMRVGGSARYFFVAQTIKELRDAIFFAKQESKPFYIFGEGSNILASDEGYSGVVIKNEIGKKQLEFRNVSEDKVLVVAGGGMVWDTFVEETVQNGLCGLENLSFIPGTVGAAPVQNIGAYGTDVSEHIEWVKVYDCESNKIIKLSNHDCDFSYRSSIFKNKKKGVYTIVSVAFMLTKEFFPNISYVDVKKYFTRKKLDAPTLENVRDAIIYIRKNKLPSVLELGTAGSFFKNPIVNQEVYSQLLEKYSDIPGFKTTDSKYKIPAAWLIDYVCGLKGERDGKVGVYDKQALAIVNYGDATAKEVLKFVGEIISKVKEKTGITLEMEVCVME